MFMIIGADGKEYGPVSADQVKGWVTAGRANGQTRAKAAGSADWKPLADYPEFAGVFAGAPPPIVSAIPAPAVGAAPAGPVDPAACAADMIARAPKLEIGAAISRSWEFYKANFWGLVGGTFIVIAVQIVAGLIPFLGALANLLLGGVFLGGLYHFYLRRLRGQTADVSDVFAGFSLLTCLGMLLLIIPGIYLAVAWVFTAPLIIDKKLEFWTAMEVSRRVVTAQWWRLFGLMIVAGFLAALGILGCVVGIIFTIPFVYSALVVAYETLCNPPPKA
jgi:hypothetical protein